ncbi:MAG: hypothetical protein MRY63_08205 [Neomegalonema sp.]|nr:hypothetical protein [Neomegalonema sp.]
MLKSVLNWIMNRRNVEPGQTPAPDTAFIRIPMGPQGLAQQIDTQLAAGGLGAARRDDAADEIVIDLYAGRSALPKLMQILSACGVEKGTMLTVEVPGDGSSGLREAIALQ